MISNFKEVKALGVSKNLMKFKPSFDEKEMENLIVGIDNDSEEKNDVIDGSLHILPRKDTSVKSTFKETSTPDVNLNIFDMDVNINFGKQPSTSLYEKTNFIPPEVSQSESNMEEDETSNINANLSNMDINVNMGYGRITIEKSMIGTTTIETTDVPPPHSSPPATFKQVVNEKENDDDVMVAFADLEINPKEDDVPNNAIMSDVDKRIDETLATHSRTFDSKLTKLHDTTCEHHVIFKKMVTDSKAFIELKIMEFSELIYKEVHNLDNLFVSFTKKVDVLMGVTTHLVEDVTAFSKEYFGDFKLKSDVDGKMFEEIEKSLFGFQETLSKFDLSLQFSIFQESISAMVMSVESCFKTKLAPTHDLVLRLSTNAPRSTNVSQGGERGARSLMGTSEDIGFLVGKVRSTKIPISLPMKLMVTTSIETTNAPRVNVYVSKLQKKGFLNKAWCYETIEITIHDKVEEFMKSMKKSYDIKNANFN
ncbi:unnamed protein product [Lactuca saligna]|uniref:Uncharacterized protein n=1 Tax=Lactuca saligna TaxID=75948 RepID=A0AA36E3W9_LACSI|nr:unnamed protein product [Lactuca saligna]